MNWKKRTILTILFPVFIAGFLWSCVAGVWIYGMNFASDWSDR